MKSTTNHHPPYRSRVRPWLLPPLLALAAAGATAPAAVAGPKNAPFKAAVVTQETLRFDPAACNAPPYLAGTTTGTGVASQMGAISFVASDCISTGATTFSFGNGQLTITAANGDELKATYSGTLTPLPNPVQLPLYTLSGHFNVTGGTGRFEAASGSGYLQGVENTQTGQGFFDLVGTISY